MISRRDLCATVVISPFIVAQSTKIAKSAPSLPTTMALPSHLIDVQAFPPLPNFKSPKEFSDQLNKRFETRAQSRGAKLTDDGQKAIRNMVEKAVPQVFQKEESGPIDKSKKYQSLPIPVRQAIAFRNLDTISDLAIVSAEREDEKYKKGKLITAAIIQGVRDFVCPMYPFCTG